MDNLDVIKLYRTEKGWQARFEGPHATLARELFDTDTLITGFTARAEAEGVLEAITQLNPDAVVLLA